MIAGPPPTQLPPSVTETAPRRGPGRPKGSTTRPNAPSRRSLQEPIAATLMTMNLALMVIPPLRQDQLDLMEIEALAKAIDEQAKQSARFRKILENALAVSSGGQLVGVLAIIGARRAARHGLIAPEIDGHLGAMLAGSMSKQAQEEARRVASAASANITSADRA